MAATSAFCAEVGVNAVPDWENPQLPSLGKEAAHASLVACPTPAIAKQIRWTANDERVKSPWYRSLNGAWKFHYSTNRLDRVPNFYATAFNDLSWSNITVPGMIELQGFGVPIYVNVNYPWKNAFPPKAADDDPNNSVGSYRRTFTVPADWNGRPVFMAFDGVYSFFYLWINGQKVGMSKESRSPAEFNITPFIKPGENQVAVEVFRWTDASYVEDQDTWRLTGIYRDVYLWSPPSLHIRDFEVHTDLDAPMTQAALRVSAKIHNYGQTAGNFSLDALLLDPQGKTVAQTGTVLASVQPGHETEASFSQPVSQPLLWSAETPNRYQLLLTVKDQTGRTLEVIPARVGFRKIEISNGQLLVNNRAILVKGVNRHEQDLEHAFSVTPESERRDLELMKRFNINAVRTCHYPNQASWYDLCDEYGIYLVAECNIETHGARDHGGNPTTNALYAPTYLDRAQRNIESQKNHASIILWSLGNEAGNGINMEANYRWIKQRDSSRPVFYDDALRSFNTDLITSMYCKPPVVAKYAAGNGERPMILCEYAYSRGNATGDLWTYWDTFYLRKRAQGGFIWDFQDKALPQPQDPNRHGLYETPRPDGKNFWAYGGDFGPAGTPSDGNQVCNGIFGTDRQPHPAAWEVKHVYQYIHTKPVDLAKRTVTIKNECDFLNVKDYANGAWRVTAEGTELFHGKLPELNLATGESKEVTVPVPNFTPKPGVEYWLEVSFKLKHDTLWAKAGHEVAWDQMKLPDTAPRPVLALGKLPPLAFTEGADQVTVKGTAFAATFDKHNAGLVSLRVNDKELIAAPLAPHFWRAPVDNDIGYRFSRVFSVWHTTTNDFEVKSVEVQQLSPQVVVVRTRLNLPKVSASWETDYTVHSSGDINVDARFFPTNRSLANLPRLGMQMRMAPGYEQLRWYGCGPQETYSDRLDARIAVYASTVDAQVVDYSRPSEMGNKVEVRWLALTDAKGNGLLAVGNPTLSACALHYTTDDLEGQRHLWEVPRRDFVTLNLDWKQMGIGGDDGWGTRPHEEYMIHCVPQSYSFTLRPITAADGDVAALARRVVKLPAQRQ